MLSLAKQKAAISFLELHANKPVNHWLTGFSVYENEKVVIALRIFLESFAISALESSLSLFSAKNRSRTGPTAGC